MKPPRKRSLIIFGAGPAGLACALEAARQKFNVTVVEKQERVGGLCRTLCRNGNYFDIGGHRFFSKSDEVNRLWQDMLGDDLMTVRRRSRIYFRNRFYDYPLRLFNVLKNLGLWNALLCLFSYFKAQWQRRGNERTFEGWVTNRFGRRLYEIFFKTYTEKVWGISCRDLSSDWAVQRIRGMSLRRAVTDALMGNQSPRVRSFVKAFQYPIYGPGLFCDRLKNETERQGVRYYLESDVISVLHNRRRVEEIQIRCGTALHSLTADEFVSSIPLTRLITQLVPAAPARVLEAAVGLKFRSFIVVNVVLNRPHLFDDNWIYIHSPEVRLGRVQNYKNWSHYMVRDLSTTTLGLEYFVSEGDELWQLSSQDMIRFAMEELEKVSLANRADLIEAFVVRIPNVYPVYEGEYQDKIEILKKYLAGFENLEVIGRCGMFRYDNSDRAILSGLYAARNLVGAGYDLWNLSTDQTYHEELGPYNREPAAAPAGRNGDRPASEPDVSRKTASV